MVSGTPYQITTKNLEMFSYSMHISDMSSVYAHHYSIRYFLVMTSKNHSKQCWHFWAILCTFWTCRLLTQVSVNTPMTIVSDIPRMVSHTPYQSKCHYIARYPRGKYKLIIISNHWNVASQSLTAPPLCNPFPAREAAVFKKTVSRWNCW